MPKRLYAWWVPLAFVLPHLLVFCCFNLFPILTGIYASFTKWTLGKAPEWVGLQNFKNLLFNQDSMYYWQFRWGMMNTIKFVVFSVPFCIIVPLFLALLLNTKCRGHKFLQSVYYLPALLSLSVVMVSWNYMFDSNSGIIKICERLFHLSPKREDRFAAGLSMGGYGAFKLGLLCPERYAAVASLSGALDVVGSTATAFDYDSILSDYRLIFGEHGEAIGSKDDLFAAAERITDDKEKLPKFFMWCGVSDKLYQENRCFNEKFGEKLGIEYHEGPGSHEWKYWDMHISDVLNWLTIKKTE